MASLEKAREKTVEDIRERAAAYTKEWRFDEERPDIGTALALLFAGMMETTREQLQQVSRDYRLKFYNLLGAEKLPGEGARGFVVFSTVNDEVPGAFVRAGERLQGKTADGGSVMFETTEDVFVSPARLEQICYADGGADFWVRSLELPLMLPTAEAGQPHVLYIGQDTLLNIKTEGEIVLDFQVLPGRREAEKERFLREDVTWSYYTQEGFVEFPEKRCENGKVYLTKEHSMPAFAPGDVHGRESCWIRMETAGLPPQSRVEFAGLKMSSAGSYLPPESIYDGNIELDVEQFFPFGEQPYPYAELYISSEEVFSKKQAFIQLDFDLDFIRVPGEIKSPELPVRWRNVMRREEFEKPEPEDMVISFVVWEYYNGFGWRRLPGTARYEGIFGDEKMAGKVSVRFSCPEDICPFLLSGKEGCCIRMRVARMVNLYVPDGIYITPRIKNLMLHYRYSEEETLPDCILCSNYLRVEEPACGQGFIPFYNQMPDGKILYLSFSTPLREQGIRILFLLEGAGGAKGNFRYEYYGKEGWALLKIEDETMGFSRSGIVTFREEQNFVRSEMFGIPGYWLRIIAEGDGVGTGGFPQIRGIYLNPAMAAAEKGSGSRGNLLAGSIHAMERSIGFISRVENPADMSGGCGEESQSQAVKRIAASLRHRERAVTAKDFEDIIYGGVRNISQIRCFPGRDGSGNKAPGHITLAVLAAHAQQGDFEYVERAILRCLKPHMDWHLHEEGRLHIVEPEWVTMKFYITAFVDETVRPGQCREAIRRRISSFLDPVTGNFDGKGWRIGELPTVMQIENLCEQMKEVLYIKNISLRDVREHGFYVLAAQGIHEIELIPQ